jgi:SPP1 gp7 family putative phage head morphogenesis protein
MAGKTDSVLEGKFPKAQIQVIYSQEAGAYAGMRQRYNPDDLQRRGGLKTYREMRLDEQVKAVMNFKRDAIFARGWQFGFDTDSSLPEEEQKRRINIFSKIIERTPGGFIDALNMVATGRDFGYSLTEKVYDNVQVDGKTYVGLGTLMGRDPCTFIFNTDEYSMLKECVQEVNGKKLPIDLNKFIHYVHSPEFDLYFGRSDLREAYKSWFWKQKMLDFWMLYGERLAGGMAVASIDGTASIVPNSAAWNALVSTIENVRSVSGMVLPAGVTVEIIQPTSTDHFKTAVEFFDLAIARSLLVPNLLGVSHTGQTGAYAQSQTQLEAFFWTLNSDKKRIESCLNDQLFTDLGDQNFGDAEYPRFKFKELSTERLKLLIENWSKMTGANLVVPTEEDERYFRSILEMPERTEEDTPLITPAQEAAQKLAESQAQAAQATAGKTAAEAGQVGKTEERVLHEAVRGELVKLGFINDNHDENGRFADGPGGGGKGGGKGGKGGGDKAVVAATQLANQKNWTDDAGRPRLTPEAVSAFESEYGVKLGRRGGIADGVVYQSPRASSFAEKRGVKINSDVSYHYTSMHGGSGSGSGRVLGFMDNRGVARDPHLAKGKVSQDVVIFDSRNSRIQYVEDRNVRVVRRTGMGRDEEAGTDQLEVWDDADYSDDADLENTQSRKFASIRRAMQRVHFSVIRDKQQEAASELSAQLALFVARTAASMLGTDDNLAKLIDTDVSDISNIEVASAAKSKLKDMITRALNTGWALGKNMALNELDRARMEYARAHPTEAPYTYERKNFASLRDKASEFFSAKGFRMAGDVSDRVRSLIQAELETAVKVGKSPFQVRVDIWNALVTKGFTSRDYARDQNETEEGVNDALDELWLDTVSNAAAYLDTLARTNLFEAMNEARYAEFTDPELADFVEGLEYSAVLDDRTTEICLELDGLHRHTDDEAWAKFKPPNHYNCRSLLIPITKGDDWDGTDDPLPNVQPQVGFK